MNIKHKYFEKQKQLQRKLKRRETEQLGRLKIKLIVRLVTVIIQRQHMDCFLNAIHLQADPFYPKFFGNFWRRLGDFREGVIGHHFQSL